MKCIEQHNGKSVTHWHVILIILDDGANAISHHYTLDHIIVTIFISGGYVTHEEVRDTEALSLLIMSTMSLGIHNVTWINLTTPCIFRLIHQGLKDTDIGQ